MKLLFIGQNYDHLLMRVSLSTGSRTSHIFLPGAQTFSRSKRASSVPRRPRVQLEQGCWERRKRTLQAAETWPANKCPQWALGSCPASTSTVKWLSIVRQGSSPLGPFKGACCTEGRAGLHLSHRESHRTKPERPKCLYTEKIQHFNVVYLQP